MKNIIEIITPYGNKYLINEAGQISRTDQPFTPSDSWKLLGIVSIKNGSFISFEELKAGNFNTHDILYKNGNPRFTVRDLDHGTKRTWGNSEVHGIKQIRFINQ